MDNIIFQRHTIPWGELSWDEYEKIAKLDPDRLAIAKAWNDQFAIPYLKFRAELKRIAQCSLRAVKNAERVKSHRIRLFFKLPSDSVIVGIDDDDWLAPDLFESLREVKKPNTLLFIWNPGRWPWRVRNPVIVKKVSFQTANHGVCGLKNSLAEEQFRSYSRHKRAVFNYVGPFERLRVEVPRRVARAKAGLSLVVKSPASTIELRSLPQPLADLSFNNPDIRHRIMGRDNRFPKELGWAREYIEMYRDLLRRTFG